jgi:acyl-CoA synthetase (AMP-forming)/AMP-acid ligase II
MIAPAPGLSLTYGQMQVDSVRFGKHLIKLGLQKGDKVSFILGNGYQTTKIFLGAMYAGFIIAPLNLRAQSSQLEYVIDHSDMKLVFFTEDHKSKLEKALKKLKRDILLIQIDNDAETIFPAGEDLSGIPLPEIKEEDDVFVTGRIKELIIKGGENIAPKEIDEVLYRHPAVLEAAAVGVPDEAYGEEIMCCVVMKPDCNTTEAELRCHCMEYLGEFKTPKRIKFMNELPKGPSGKIQRLKLPHMLR